MPNQYDVDITVTTTASGTTFAYSDDALEVYSKDEIRFRCNKDFAINFEQKKSPFKPKVLSISGPANTYTSYYKAKGVKKRTPHKYIVAAFVGGANPIATDDPQIIVDDDGGGG